MRILPLALAGLLLFLAAQVFAQSVGIVGSVLDPQMNGGARVASHIRLLSGSSFNLNGGAVITGDILVPRKPAVTGHGKPTGGRGRDETGSISPGNYTILFSGNTILGRAVRRTNGHKLPIRHRHIVPSRSRRPFVPGLSHLAIAQK